MPLKVLHHPSICHLLAIPIRTAIRNQLERHGDVVKQSTARKSLDLGLRNYTRQDVQYKRVTPRFFAVSSYKGDKVWYDRCNFSAQLVHCVLINYPAEEEHAWDDVVTRISLSLKGK